jgi:hypothetical protein
MPKLGMDRISGLLVRARDDGLAFLVLVLSFPLLLLLSISAAVSDRDDWRVD